MSDYTSIFTYIFPIIYFTILFFLAAHSFIRNGIRFKSVGLMFLVITHFVGYASLPFRVDALVPADVYMPVEYINDVSLKSFIGIIIFYLASHLLSPKPRGMARGKIFFGSANLFVAISLSVSILAMIIFYITKGSSFDSDNYASKLGENAGSGLLLMPMSAFVPAVIVYSFTSKSKYAFAKSCGISILFGVAFYILIGGSRNVMFSALLMATLICFVTGKINKFKFLIIGCIGLFLVAALGMLRYSNSMSSSGAALSLAIQYLTDSLSPINYQYEAVKYYDNTTNPDAVGGIYYMFSQFSGFVPRFLWEEKPIVTMNSSYYFTTNILGMSSGLNMASTLLGSSLVLFGGYFYWLAYALSGLVVRMLDIIINSNKLTVMSIAGFVTVPFTFFMARESLELFMFIYFKNLIVVSFVYLLFKVASSIIPKKTA